MEPCVIQLYHSVALIVSAYVFNLFVRLLDCAVLWLGFHLQFRRP